MDKKSIRKDMLNKLNKLDRKEYAKLSQRIKERVITLDEFRQANIIGLTISRFPEVDTSPIIEAAWSLGKQIAVPKCLRQTRELDFRLLMSYDDLEIVYGDLREPKVDKTDSVANEEIDLQIVPGVVFSDEGYRIGFGGGYYDRYMAHFEGKAIALAFECQTGKLVPRESHDVPIGNIVTEERMLDCRKGKNGD